MMCRFLSPGGWLDMRKLLVQFVLILIISTLFFPVTGVLAYNHTVILRVVRVTPDWMPYASTDGWTQAVKIKESSKLKYFEVAIWEETSSVHLYEFPYSYNPLYGQGKTDQQKINYREQFAIKKFTNMPSEPFAKSSFLKSAFSSIVDILARRYFYSSHALVYSGHGGPGGALFEAMLSPTHVQDLLKHWANKIEQKLAFVDMGGPCNKGSFSDLNAFCPFAEYYLASDLPNGGYTMDNWTVEKYDETNPDYRYHDLIANNSTLYQVLVKRITLKRKEYEYSRINMNNNKVEQGNYLYSCQAFKRLYDKVRPIKNSFPVYADLRSLLTGLGSSYMQTFDATIVAAAHNRDFFPWEKVANGMLTPSGGWYSPLDKLSYPILKYPEKRRPTITPIVLPLLLSSAY